MADAAEQLLADKVWLRQVLRLPRMQPAKALAASRLQEKSRAAVAPGSRLMVLLRRWPSATIALANTAHASFKMTAAQQLACDAATFAGPLHAKLPIAFTQRIHLAFVARKIFLDEVPVHVRALWRIGRLLRVGKHLGRKDRIADRLLDDRETRQAAVFRSHCDVAAPQRVAAVIQNVRRISVETGAPPDVVEETYRTLIAAFIKAEQAEHQRLRPNVSSE
jgi:isochorismate pyruvate lyase